MPFRVSIYFTQQGELNAGYSENYWSVHTSLAAVTTSAQQLRLALKAVKGKGVASYRIRISDLSNFRSITLLRFVDDQTYNPPGSYSNADFVNTAGLLKLSGTDGTAQYIARQWIRSVEDGDVDVGGRWSPSPPTVTALNNLQALLVTNSNNWRMNVQDKTQVKFKLENVTAAGVVTITAHPFVNGDQVRISRSAGIAGLNKIWTVNKLDANTFQLLPPPVPPFATALTKPGTAQKQIKKYVPISAAVIDRATSHRTGRPFGLASGRRKVRTH